MYRFELMQLGHALSLALLAEALDKPDAEQAYLCNEVTAIWFQAGKRLRAQARLGTFGELLDQILAGLVFAGMEIYSEDKVDLEAERARVQAGSVIGMALHELLEHLEKGGNLGGKFG